MSKKNAVLAAALSLGLSFCASNQASMQRQMQKDPQYNYRKGTDYLNVSNIDQALVYFNKCLELDPKFLQAWNGIGLARSMKGDLKGSAEAFNKCLAIDPHYADAHNNLGMVYQVMKQWDKAETEYRSALAEPGYTHKEMPYCNLAMLYFNQGRLDSAYENVEAALLQQPRMAKAHNLKGIILDSQNRLREAQEAFEQAVKIVPNDVLFNYYLGVAYYKNGEFAKAKDKLMEVYASLTDPDFRGKAAAILKELGELK